MELGGDDEYLVDCSYLAEITPTRHMHKTIRFGDYVYLLGGIFKDPKNNQLKWLNTC